MKYDFDLENRKEARKQLIYIYRIRTEYGPDIKKRRQDLSQ